jgi:hypothetical protein
MIFKKSIFPILALALLFTSCNKDEETTTAEERQAAEQASKDFMLAENIFENVFKMVDTEAKKQGDLNGFQSPEVVDDRNNCPGVGFEITPQTIFPATLTLDFDTGCTTDNGVVAAGKIVAIFNGLLLSEGTSYTLSFENFIYANNTVNGSYILSNDGMNASGQPTFSAVIDGQITKADGTSFTYQSTNVASQTEGNDTNFFTDGLAGIFDDVWSSEREGTIVRGDGVTLSVTTPEAIRNPLTCRWPVSGTYALELSDPALTGSIDFGSGDCDNKALLTVGDFELEIEL